MTEQLNAKYWWANIDEDGTVLYHDADIAANARVREIMIRAQANKTELGYWRDIATDLAALVDELEARLRCPERIFTNYLFFLEELNLYAHEYLQVLPNDKGEDIYDSYRGFAADELGKFREWVKLRGGGKV